MPIYAYRCERCGHELDALQKITEPALTDCPQCGSASLQKKLTAPGFQLKGSGWYQTDFKASGSKPAAKADAGAAKPDAGSADAKPAAGAAAESAPAKAETKAPAGSAPAA